MKDRILCGTKQIVAGEQVMSSLKGTVGNEIRWVRGIPTEEECRECFIFWGGETRNVDCVHWPGTSSPISYTDGWYAAVRILPPEAAEDPDKWVDITETHPNHIPRVGSWLYSEEEDAVVYLIGLTPESLFVVQYTKFGALDIWNDLSGYRVVGELNGVTNSDQGWEWKPKKKIQRKWIIEYWCDDVEGVVPPDPFTSNDWIRTNETRKV